MKAIILAGGMGSRLSEETVARPKPMVEIGGRPILWHILKIYSHYGINEFVICLGYKGYVIKEYFVNYALHACDLTVEVKSNSLKFHGAASEDWKITLVDTGPETGTGGRLRRVLPYVEQDEMFCFTYGDGVADINISGLIEFHKAHGKLVTLTAVQPAGKYGAIYINADSSVEKFVEKPRGDGGWINGGFFVLSPKVSEHLSGSDSTMWEREPLQSLTKSNQVAAFRHTGYWQSMDTISDRNLLEGIWSSGEAPWKVWK